MKTTELGLNAEIASLVALCKLRHPSSSSGGGLTTSHPHTFMVTFELINTEKVFIGKMRNMYSEFHRRLRAQLMFQAEEFPDPIDAQLDRLFSHAIGFAERHDEFLTSLKENCRKSCFLRKVGETFKKFVSDSTPFYSEYAQRYADITYQLRKYQRSHKRFCEFIFVSEICAGESIDSLRIAPIQRVPRYILLLKELLQGIIETSFQGKSILSAIESCKQMTREIDNSIHIGEKISQVHVLHDVFFEGSVNLMDSSRCLLKSGEVTKLFKHQAMHMSRGKRYVFFLFSDCLIYSEIEGSHRIKHVFHLTAIQVISLERPNSLRIVSPIKSLSLLFDSPEDQKSWTNELHEAGSKSPACPDDMTPQEFETFVMTGSGPSPKKNRLVASSLIAKSHKGLRRASIRSFWSHPTRLRAFATALAGSALILPTTRIPGKS
uniref:DH domain-containing protein n=1 Tax=Spongospora subterranea TaxID=70186 RepID=A0A0H5R7N4_9EUKA|eukprot:CRZ09826.1 hypothetical protein [Spongospora subterranea]